MQLHLFYCPTIQWKRCNSTCRNIWKFYYEIGRNDEENDKIIKEGGQNDLWFHIKKKIDILPDKYID